MSLAKYPGLPPDAASSRLDAFAGSPLQVFLLAIIIVANWPCFDWTSSAKDDNAIIAATIVMDYSLET